MANENEKNPSALEELRRLKRTDRIKSLDIHEPELRDFNAENIFHIDEEPEKKTIFGKRSAKTHVKINENIFDDEIALRQEFEKWFEEFKKIKTKWWWYCNVKFL